MTKLRAIELTCPICEGDFPSEAVVATNALGGKRTDFHERAAGVQPLPYLVHTCDRCGYTGAERDFTDAAEVPAALRERVWSELAPAFARARATRPAGSEKYEAAARVAEWSGRGAREVAELLLRAAWCCVDEEDVEAERFFRRQAARAFESALGAWDDVTTHERAVVTYLVGELWRRVGDVARARAWFDRVPDAVVDSATQRWVIAAARQQRDAPREWFG